MGGGIARDAAAALGLRGGMIALAGMVDYDVNHRAINDQAFEMPLAFEH